MVGFLGEPTRLVMKPVKPDFFLRTDGILGSFASSENLLGPFNWFSDTLAPCDFSAAMMSGAAEKLADCSRVGPGTRGSGEV